MATMNWLLVAIAALAATCAHGGYVHAPGYCTMYGQKFISNTPKLYNKPAPPVDDVEAMRERLSYICGASVADELLTPVAGSNVSTLCCDDAQLSTLESKFSLPVPIISSCPACWSNFAAFFCRFTCSPSQSLFLEPVEVSDGAYVEHTAFYAHEEALDGFYDSCKEVKYGAANNLALDFIAPNAKSGLSMVQSLGEKNLLNPILMEFFTDVSKFPENVTGLNAATKPCDSSDPEVRCSCVDCLNTCTLDLGALPDTGLCYVGNPRLSCLALSGIVIYIVLILILASLMLPSAVASRVGRYWNNNVRNAPSPNPFGSELGGVETSPMLSPLLEAQRRFVPWPVDAFLQKIFFKLGSFCANNRIMVIMSAISSILILSGGWAFFGVETRPIKLWVDPASEALAQKAYFDETFAPFYRITQLIVSKRDESQRVLDWDFLNKTWDVQEKIENLWVLVPLDTEDAPIVNVTLNDLCFTPTDGECATQSFSGWYGKDKRDGFRRDKSLKALKTCIFKSGQPDCFSPAGQPLTPNLVLGGVSNPDIPHNETNSNWREDWLNAKALAISFVLNNPQNETFQKMAVAWEQEAVRVIQEVQADLSSDLSDESMEIAFMTESSVEDELSRDMLADVPTVALSYALMFIYASFALGKLKFSSPREFVVDSKFSLGVAGILIVIASVSASVGLLSYFKIKATLIIAEVIPFLVLAVGVDNIFILVNTFERITSACNRRGPRLAVETRVAYTLSQVGPSILLSSLSETIAFGLGFLVTMPAVSVFSLYAACAVLINILLQITVFVSLLTLDAKRRESGRVDCLPCIQVKSGDALLEDDSDEKVPYGHLPMLERLFRTHYAPMLLKRRVKLAVVAVFTTLFVFLGLYNLSAVPLGLDQKTALPKDSYLIHYFEALEKYLEVGPPVYFVVIAASKNNETILNVLDLNDQKKISGKMRDCNPNSIGNVLELEYQRSRANEQDRSLQSAIATPIANWFDDFVNHMNVVDRPCCIQDRNPLSCYLEPIDIDPIDPDDTGADEGPDNFNTSCGCWKWRALIPTTTAGLEPLFNYYLEAGARHPNDVGGLPTNGSQVMHSIHEWLDHQPSRHCPNAGKAAYGSALKIRDGRVTSFHFRTYHHVLRTQQDFIDAYADAKRIADEIMRESLGLDPATARVTADDGKEYSPVFPYSVFYVFFEQYLFVTGMATSLVLGALLAIFVVVTLFLGSPATAAVIVMVVGMMTVDLLGVMYAWNISLNAVSVVNLIIGVGIGVEFCVHVARGVITDARYKLPVVSSDSVNMGGDSGAYDEVLNDDNDDAMEPVERSLVEMGSSVFSGITLTKLIGIMVLATAHSTIFEVFYFRMYFTIVVLGATHGLILLPVLMSLLRIGEWQRGVRGPELATLMESMRRRRS